MKFYQSVGKRPILLHREVPDFVSNRLQAAINNEAYSLISWGIVSASDLDLAVTQGRDLRWAPTGPIVTNALGGGGGPDGFSQRIERLGPSIQTWEEDILKNRVDWSRERLSALEDSVKKSLSDVYWSNLVAERDAVLVQLLAAGKIPKFCTALLQNRVRIICHCLACLGVRQEQLPYIVILLSRDAK
ncbi:3-hydroxyacyl-CoA dehyrogenase [Apiospora aurea]|uniref:3-hydroxyacyl-CoA dehyrogenase n=1 Tax=Apiospora aurea TaxID=335848 RepID=A0ABR1Q6A2_9PEZI